LGVWRLRFSLDGTTAASTSAETDGQGRLYIPKGVREKYGENIVTHEDGTELVAVADDPLAAVRETAGELRDAPVGKIRAGIKQRRKLRPVRKGPIDDDTRRNRLRRHERAPLSRTTPGLSGE